MNEDLNQRLQRLAIVERRANQRDRELRYGTHRRHPYGIVPSATYHKKQPKLLDDLIVVGLALAVGVIFALTA